MCLPLERIFIWLFKIKELQHFLQHISENSYFLWDCFLLIPPKDTFTQCIAKTGCKTFSLSKNIFSFSSSRLSSSSEAWKVAFWKGVRLLLTDCGFKFLSSLHRSLWTFYRLGVARGGQFKFLSSVDRFLEAALVCISGGCKVDF